MRRELYITITVLMIAALIAFPGAAEEETIDGFELVFKSGNVSSTDPTPSFTVPEGNYTLMYYWKMSESGTTYRIYASDIVVDGTGIYTDGQPYDCPTDMGDRTLRFDAGDKRLDAVYGKLAAAAETTINGGATEQTLILSTPAKNNNTWFLLKRPAIFETEVTVTGNDGTSTGNVYAEMLVTGDTKTSFTLTDGTNTYTENRVPADKKTLSNTYNTSSDGTRVYDPQPLYYNASFENVPAGRYTLTVTAENENTGAKSVTEKTVTIKDPSSAAITEDRYVVIITGCTYQIPAVEKLIADGFFQDPDNHIKFSHYQTTLTDIGTGALYDSLKADMEKADIVYINMINTSVRGAIVTDLYNMSKANNASYAPVIVVSNVTDTAFVNHLEQTIPSAFNPGTYKTELYTYFSNTGYDGDNLEQMIYKMLNDFKGCNFDVTPAHGLPDNAVYHPDSDDLVYETLAEYLNWYKNRTNGHAYDENNGTIGLMFYSSYYPGKIGPVDAIIKEAESRGLNVIPIFVYSSTAMTMGPTYFADGSGNPIVDVVVSCNRFLSVPPFDTDAFDVPIINGLVANMTYDEWKNSTNPFSKNLNRYYRPENAGMIDPILIGYTETIDSVETYLPMPEQIAYLTDRCQGLIELKRAENKDKNIAVIYYNHEGGKSGIGASYLDVAASIIALVDRMAGDGYHIDPATNFTEETLIEAFLTNGYNVGSWAPGQLEALVETGKVAVIPAETYERWFDEFFKDDPDKDRRKQEVIDEWGEAPGNLMTVTNESGTYIVIPLVDVTDPAAGTVDGSGRVILAPQPARGQFTSYETLYHDGALVPTHQYIAFYSWLQHPESEGGFGADAIVYMGRHGTQEWLPGRENGLSRYEWPCLMHGSMPVVYYYVVDGLSEGIQAKRRGNAVIVDHLTPAIVEADLYGDYADLAALIQNYGLAMEDDLKNAYKESILEKVNKLNLKSAVNMTLAAGTDAEFDAFLEELEDVVTSVRQSTMPYGLHILGRSPEGDALVSTLKVMLGSAYVSAVEAAAQSAYTPELPSKLIEAVVIDGKSAADAQTQAGLTPDAAVGNYLNNAASYAEGFRKSAREIDQLMRALNAGFIKPGASGDPVRKPGILPTGYNFQTLDASGVPTKEAQALGQQMAKELLDGYKQNGSYPKALAYVLWSSETVRHEGVVEACMMYLMGVEYDFTSSSSPTVIKPVDGFEYPTLDVVMQISGLYRDSFPDLIGRLDAAVVAAYNVDNPNGNFLKENIDAEKEKIKNAHPTISEEDAFTIASLRVFGPESGNYGTGMSSLASASNTWQERAEMAEYYMDRMGFAYANRQITGCDPDVRIWGMDTATLIKLATGDESGSSSGVDIFRDVLSKVEVTVHSRSTNTYGVLDNDDFFQYLGGLNLAITTLTGKSPESFVMDLKNPGTEKFSTLADYMSSEMYSKYFNQAWIDGMMQHGYAGAGEMSDFVENLWGWEAMMPGLVTDAMWDAVFDVYVNGSVSDFLKNGDNNYAFQSITSRLLEAARTGNWNASDEVLSKLVSEHVDSVVDNGVACCHHSCGNPLGDAFISGIMSSLGAVDKETAEKFAELMENATDRKFNIDFDDEDGKVTTGGSGTGSATIVDPNGTTTDKTQTGQTAPSDDQASESTSDDKTDEAKGEGYGNDASLPAGRISGYEMVQKTIDNTAASLKNYLENPTFSTSNMVVILLVIAFVGLVFYGFRKKGI